MTKINRVSSSLFHSHVFLGEEHQKSERKTWAVIWLCGVMMVAEIVGGFLFGSIALVADGLHMSTHAGALLLAALAYTYARKHADDSRFTFGTGKFGDLAGFTSAIILAMIALLIGYESISRIFAPVPIHFAEAIPIACLGLVVNIASAWLLSGGVHHHHGHGHGHTEDKHDHGEAHHLTTRAGAVVLKVFEDGVPPRFRLRAEAGPVLMADAVTIETVHPDGDRHQFTMKEQDGYLESVEEIAEPHAFVANVRIGEDHYPVVFVEPEHAAQELAHRDNNIRAAVIHVIADAAVSMLVIGGLLLARVFGWLWMDPLAGVIGACVIASWSYGLVRDTGSILLDMNPDRRMADNLRQTIERDGDEVGDLHLWRLGPGHLGAIISVSTKAPHDPDYYRAKLAPFRSVSHLTIEVHQEDVRGGSRACA
jgi:cation diffusion facilitator family transporter